MIYAPHTLQVKVENKPTEDEFGNPIFPDEPFTWKTIGPCRCDDNSTKRFESPNGVSFTPSYHIVYDDERIAGGTYVRCLREDGTVRGEGEVYKPEECNCLPYAELWV